MGEIYKQIKVKYTDKGRLHPLKVVQGSDWIDLYTEDDEMLTIGSCKVISLGVSIELPDKYEAIIAARSSTFKNWGIIIPNGIGIIDNSYNGNDDVWHFLAFATRDVVIPAGTRLCQFRILRNQPSIEIKAVLSLSNENRGGFGSTGV